MSPRQTQSAGGLNLLAGVLQTMRRPTKDFIEQFPSTAAHFTTSFPTSSEFREAQAEGKQHVLMFVAMMSDEMLTKAASHREPTDMFSQYQFASRLVLLGQEFDAMAARKSKSPRGASERNEWQGFLECRLTEEQLAELDNQKPKPAEIWAAVDEMILSDYRFTLSYNKNLKLASVTVIDDSKERKTGGYALSSADSDGALALKMAVYKHYVVLDKNWEQLLSVEPKVRRG